MSKVIKIGVVTSYIIIFALLIAFMYFGSFWFGREERRVVFILGLLYTLATTLILTLRFFKELGVIRTLIYGFIYTFSWILFFLLTFYNIEYILNSKYIIYSWPEWLDSIISWDVRVGLYR